MFQTASVSLSGPAFSFLLYETSKACVRQDGFLLGEIVHKEITSITDNEQKQVDISKIIKINSVVPCTKGHFVKGKVDKDKIRRLLGPNFNKVVAWYKYEPFSNLKMTLKDRAIHKQFRELFDIPPDLFSFCSVSMECADNFSSYNYQQIFFRYCNGCFDRLGIQISNLSEPNNSYKNSEPASEVFGKILSTIKMDLENTKGVIAVREIENAVQKHISNTVTELAKAEKTLFDLECEIDRLRQVKKSKIETVSNESSKESKVVSEDLIYFEESVESGTVNEKSGNSPEVIRKSPRTRSKVAKKCESENDVEASGDIDCNKKDEVIQNVQTSPETLRRTPKSKNRAKPKTKT